VSAGTHADHMIPAAEIQRCIFGTSPCLKRAVCLDRHGQKMGFSCHLAEIFRAGLAMGKPLIRSEFRRDRHLSLTNRPSVGFLKPVRSDVKGYSPEELIVELGGSEDLTFYKIHWWSRPSQPPRRIGLRIRKQTRECPLIMVFGG
jgi:hypothetical protein